MSEATYTKGPWSLFPMETGWYVNQQGGPGYVGTMHRVSHRAEECEANARLIAAAPDLYDAADNALNALIGCCVPAGGVDDRKTILEAQAMLRAAIAKATQGA